MTDANYSLWWTLSFLHHHQWRECQWQTCQFWLRGAGLGTRVPLKDAEPSRHAHGVLMWQFWKLCRTLAAPILFVLTQRNKYCSCMLSSCNCHRLVCAGTHIVANLVMLLTDAPSWSSWTLNGLRVPSHGAHSDKNTKKLQNKTKNKSGGKRRYGLWPPPVNPRTKAGEADSQCFILPNRTEWYPMMILCVRLRWPSAPLIFFEQRIFTILNTNSLPD